MNIDGFDYIAQNGLELYEEDVLEMFRDHMEEKYPYFYFGGKIVSVEIMLDTLYPTQYEAEYKKWVDEQIEAGVLRKWEDMNERRVRVEDLVAGDLIDLEEFGPLLSPADVLVLRTEFAEVKEVTIMDDGTVVVGTDVVNVALPLGTRVIIGSYKD